VSYVVYLPWPSAKLSSNARGAWQTKESARKDAVNYGMAIARMTDPDNFDFHGNLNINIKIFPPDNRRRDLLNVVHSLKNYIDGVCRERGFDDSQIRRGSEEFGAVYPGGQIMLTFTRME
jgi:hypothetical protein